MDQITDSPSNAAKQAPTANDASTALGHLLLRVGNGRRMQLAPGEFLWHVDDPADSVALLHEGLLEVVSPICGNDDLCVLRLLGPGAVLGEVSCIDGGARSAGIRAARDAVVECWTADEFLALMRRHPRMLELLLRQQVATVRSLSEQFTQTHYRTLIDQLTQLYNLGFFRERLSLELTRARETGDAIAVVMLDLDFFKQFNDRFGHISGNDALIKVGQLLRKTGRRGEIVARYGGEEFVALLYGADCSEGWRFAERFRRSVEEADFGDEPGTAPRHLTISAGVACFPDDARSVRSLIAAADANLYLAKEQGRNCVVASRAV